MSETKDFKYTAKIDVKNMVNNQEGLPGNVEVVNVEFLTPARVTVMQDGKSKSIMLNIDIINKSAYDGFGKVELSEKIFEYLDRINTLPEDFFAASDDVYDAVAEVEQERQRIKQLGEGDGRGNEAEGQDFGSWQEGREASTSPHVRDDHGVD